MCECYGLAMKEVRIPMEDKEHRAMTKIKKHLTWKQLLLKGADLPYIKNSEEMETSSSKTVK